MHFSFYFVYEVFSIGHAWMWELDCEESWVPKNWCFWTVMLEKTLESPLDCKEIQPVHPKGDQSWVFTGRTDAEAETPIVWSPHMKGWLIGTGWKGLGAGGEGDDKGWDGWMASLTQWHLPKHGFGETPGVGDGQGGLACCNSWSHKESDMTDQQNWTDWCSLPVVWPQAKLC